MSPGASMNQQFSLMHIWEHGDFVTHAVAIILLIMSVASWTAIALGVFRQKKFKRPRAVIRSFWTKSTLEEGIAHIRDDSSPWKILALEGQYAAQGFAVCAQEPHTPNARADWIVRSLANVIDKIAVYQSYGLVLLSSIGATAPFVGLFGTVWGIYHTLIALSGGGQMTIDQVAGPIGEALVMTAFGLVVAIPAVLGNNAIANSNRRNLQELGTFAQDIQAFLVTGQRPLSALQK